MWNVQRTAFSVLWCHLHLVSSPCIPSKCHWILRQLLCSLHRQIIARGLLDVFRDFSNNEEDFLAVMEIVVRLSEDAGLKVCFCLFFNLYKLFYINCNIGSADFRF